MRIQQACRPSTTSAHSLHFKTFVAFLIFMDLPILCNVHNILAFMEFLYQNPISPKVISTCISSIHSRAQLYGWDTSATSHPAVLRYVRSVSINTKLNPTPGAFLTFPPYIISPCHVTSSLIQFYSGLFFSRLFMVSSGCLTLTPIVPLDSTLTSTCSDKISYLLHLAPTY